MDGVSAAMVICNGVDADRASSWVISMETLGKVLHSQQGESADREQLVRIIMVRDGGVRSIMVRPRDGAGRAACDDVMTLIDSSRWFSAANCT